MRPFLMLTTRTSPPVLEEEYHSVMKTAGLDPSTLILHDLNATPLGDLDLDAYSGCFLGGSAFNASDPPEIQSEIQMRVEKELGQLYDQAIAHDFPFLGMCYALGTLTTHLGGTVDREHGEEVDAPLITLTESGRADPLLEGVPDTFRSYVAHKESVAILPATTTLLATGVNCPVQMVKAGRNVHAAQFHPELNAEGLLLRMGEYVDGGYFTPEDMLDIHAAAAQHDVAPSHRIVANFVRLFARA